jgi:hypothetical protein
MTRAASLGGVRGSLPSVHAERLASREIITGEFRPDGVQSQIFSPGCTRRGYRGLIAVRPQKVPLLRPISASAGAAILAPKPHASGRRGHAPSPSNTHPATGCGKRTEVSGRMNPAPTRRSRQKRRNKHRAASAGAPPPAPPRANPARRGENVDRAPDGPRPSSNETPFPEAWGRAFSIDSATARQAAGSRFWTARQTKYTGIPTRMTPNPKSVWRGDSITALPSMATEASRKTIGTKG